jgi:hypothetical protein
MFGCGFLTLGKVFIMLWRSKPTRDIGLGP